MDANVERFRAEVTPFLGDWKSIDLKVIASRLGDKWIYGTIKAVLDSSDLATPTRQDLPSQEGLLIAHERWDIKRLEDLLTSLSSGDLQIQGQTIIVENANTNPKMNYTFERMTRRDSMQRLGIGSYALYLQSWAGMAMLEGNKGPIVDSLMRADKYPWDGIIDLLTNFINVSPNFARSMPTKLVEVVAPIAVWIKDASLIGNDGIKVNVEHARSVSTGDLELSAIEYVSGESQIRLRQTKKSIVDDAHFAFEVKFPKMIELAIAILTYRNHDIDRVELFGKPRSGINPRLAILWQEGLEDFLTSLKDEKDKYFEDRVSILFHILGLSPGHYGRVNQDNPDILIFPESNDWGLVVECTKENIDNNNKLSKLAYRMKLLLRSMPGVSLHPVLVTKVLRALLNETDKEKASKEGISIITGNDFETLLRMAIEGAELEKVCDYILSLTPRMPGSSGFGGLGGSTS